VLGYPSPNYSTYPDKPPFSDLRAMGLDGVHGAVSGCRGLQPLPARECAKVAPKLPQADAEEYLAAKMMGDGATGRR